MPYTPAGTAHDFTSVGRELVWSASVGETGHAKPTYTPAGSTFKCILVPLTGDKSIEGAALLDVTEYYLEVPRSKSLDSRSHIDVGGVEFVIKDVPLDQTMDRIWKRILVTKV